MCLRNIQHNLGTCACLKQGDVVHPEIEMLVSYVLLYLKHTEPNMKPQSSSILDSVANLEMSLAGYLAC